jgi:hypothetical protein
VLLGAAAFVVLGTGAPAAAASPHLLSLPAGIAQFNGVTLGTIGGPINLQIQNQGPNTDTIDLTNPSDLSFSGTGADDYVITPGNCPGNGTTTVVLTSGFACNLHAFFLPGALGDRSAAATFKGDQDAQGTSAHLDGTGLIGYYQVDEFGDVANYGDAINYGDTGNDNLNFPIVGMASTGDNGGYWLVASDGGIFAFGPSAGFFGSTGAIHLNQPIVGMAGTPDNGGYWLVASDGGIFSYGDAQFYGSTGAIHLNQPIVGMAATPTGNGYWLVASDGGIFAYGDAQFHGSTGAIHLNKPVVGMESTPNGNGYWLVASDGGVFAYNAPFYGSTGAIVLNQPIVAMTAMPDNSGYWFSAADGGVFNFGMAPFQGSGIPNPNLDIIVDMATDGSPTLQALVGIPAVRTLKLEHASPALRAAIAAGDR